MNLEASLESFLDTQLEDTQALPGGVSNAPAEVASGARPPRMSYSHQAMAEYILSNPWASQDQIAAHFGYSASWISTIICSGAFQALLAKRRDELVDPVLRASIKEQLDGILARSLEILRVKLDRPAASVPDQLVLQAAKVAAQAAGFGARASDSPPPPPVNVNLHFEELGGRLEVLLRRKREVLDHDVLGETEDRQSA